MTNERTKPFTSLTVCGHMHADTYKIPSLTYSQPILTHFFLVIQFSWNQIFVSVELLCSILDVIHKRVPELIHKKTEQLESWSLLHRSFALSHMRTESVNNFKWMMLRLQITCTIPAHRLPICSGCNLKNEKSNKSTAALEPNGIGMVKMRIL